MLLSDTKLIHIDHVVKVWSYEINLDDYYEFVNAIYTVKSQIEIESNTSEQHFISNAQAISLVVQMDCENRDAEADGNCSSLKLDNGLLKSTKLFT